MSQKNDALIGHLSGQVVALTQIVAILIHLAPSKQYIMAALQNNSPMRQVEIPRSVREFSSTFQNQYADGHNSVYDNIRSVLDNI